MKNNHAGESIFSPTLASCREAAQKWLAARKQFARQRWIHLVDGLTVYKKENSVWVPVMTDASTCRINPVWAVVLNLIFPGVAQMLSGQQVKGLLYLAGFYVLYFSFPTPFVSMVFAIVVCADTVYTFKRLRGGRPVRKLGFFC